MIRVCEFVVRVTSALEIAAAVLESSSYSAFVVIVPRWLENLGSPHYGTLTDLDVTRLAAWPATSRARIKSRGSVLSSCIPTTLGEHDGVETILRRNGLFPEIHSPVLRRTFNIELGGSSYAKSLTPS